MNAIPNFLRVLFAVELFERISYYGVRTLLVLFLISHFGFHDARAYAVYSVSAALVYSTPVLGGVLADRIFGFRRMVALGGILIALAQAVILFSMYDTGYFFFGLGLVCVGTGFFKANINNLLGSCYAANDPNRTHGFVFLHVGVNIGSALASIICGYVAHYYGWYFGYMIPAISMLISLGLFYRYRYVFGEHGASPDPNRLKRRYLGFSLFDFMLIGSILLGLFYGKVIEDNLFDTRVFHYFGALMLAVFAYVIASAKEKQKLIALGFMMLCLIVFFAMEMQLGSLMALFANRNVVQQVFGLPIPATVSQAINPLTIILLGLGISSRRLKRNRFQVTKFILGMLTTSLCFGLLYYGCLNADADYRVPYIYFLCAIALIGLGELIVWPFVQSNITALSPQNLRGFMMSLVMLFIAFANVAGIHIGRFMSVPMLDGHYDPAQSLDIYMQGFKHIAIYNALFVIAFIPLFYFMRRVLKKYETEIEIKKDGFVNHLKSNIDIIKEERNYMFNLFKKSKKKEAHKSATKHTTSNATHTHAGHAGQHSAHEAAHKAEVKKTAAKKSPAKKKAVAKKPAVKKAAVKKAVVKKAAVKKAVVKKSPAKKPVAKKPAVKKAVVKKAAVKKAVVKKSPAKKTVAKKPAVKKSPAKKAVAKKPAAKKQAAKK